MAILQSCYIPWKGYFDLLNTVDHLVIFDDAQFAKRHWHNRNRIKTPHGTQWLTIPVATKGQFHQAIQDTMISAPWAQKHWRAIAHNYAKAPFFHNYEDALREAYEKADHLDHLSAVNALFTETLAKLLGISTKLTWSRNYGANGAKTERLLSICKQVGARTYISGPSAKSYFEGDRFEEAGIAYDWMDYGGYPQYPQLHGPFEHAVSIIDLLFNVGPDAQLYMKSFPERARHAG